MIRNHMVATCSEVYNESIIKSLTSLSEESVYSTYYRIIFPHNSYSRPCEALPNKRYAAFVSDHPIAAIGKLACGCVANCPVNLINRFVLRASPKQTTPIPVLPNSY